jgi:hypothetical protein
MRIITLAGFSLAAVLGCATALNASEAGWALSGGANFTAGLGAVAGSTGPQALYIQGAENAGSRKFYLGTLQRQIPAAALRGQRVRLSLRMKNEGIASTMVSLRISRPGGAGIRAPAVQHWQTDDGAAWQVRQFVLDVPADAQDLTLDVSVKDKAKVWVDELKLEAVGQDVALTASGRTQGGYQGSPFTSWDGGGAQANTDNLTPDPSAYAPLIGGSFVAGGTPVAMPGQTPR